MVIRCLMHPASLPTTWWDAVSIHWPCFHTAPIHVTIQWLIIQPWAYQDMSCFHWEDHSNQLILGCWPTTWPCGSCEIMNGPYLQVSWWLRKIGEEDCPSQRDTGGRLAPVQARSMPLLHFWEGTIWRTCLRRTYSKKEGLQSWEGCTSLEKRWIPRRPRYKRK